MSPKEWASAQVLETGAPVTGQLLAIQRCDGSPAFVINSASPVRDAAGQIVGSAVALQDITDLRQTEQALHESEERFRLAAESVSDIIWQWNISTGAVNWHGRIDELLGYGAGEFPRTVEAWEQVIHPEDRDRVLTALDQHLKEGGPYREEYRVLRKDGTRSYWLDCGVAQREEGGKPRRMIGSISDVTER